MKSSFSRNLFPSIMVLLLALIAVGLTLQVLAKSIMDSRALERLRVQAETVGRLASAYHNSGSGREEDFYLNLSVAAQASGTDTVICDSTGKLVLCSDAPMGCSHQGLYIGKDYMEQVVAKGSMGSIGYLEGIYDRERYMVAIPCTDDAGTVLGVVIASMDAAQTGQALRQLYRIYLITSLFVILVAVTIMIWAARRHSRPLQQMRKAAVAFGHGDLEARVSVNTACPVEIQELALAFNNMADSLQKSEYRRQEFVANVSHELKTPMTTIAGFADGILDGTIPPERQDHYLQLISQETKRLNRLVRSMLDTAQLQEDAIIPDEKKSRFDLGDCSVQVLLRFEQKITEKNLNVQVQFPDVPVYTWAQEDQITQVIYNLVDNAVKFCPPEGDLGLQLRTGGNKIYFSISNSGKTIPPEELPLVFDRFHKLDKSRMENRDGWGLGLYIVKTIICAHGEDISVVSRDGVTEFTFTLPQVG